MSLPMEKLTLNAKAISAGFGTSENENATKFVAIGFEVVDEQFAGETITWFGYFTEKTTARTLESLQHMGFASDDLMLLEDIDAARCAEVLPNVVQIVCEPEEYQGEWTLKVRWVNRSGAGKFKAKQPLVGNDLKAFAAQMKGALRNARGAAGARPASTPAQSRAATAGWSGNSAGGGSKDDIPFASCAVSDEPSSLAKVLR